MKKLCINKLTIRGDFNTFINDNIVDGKLKFSNMIPLPEDIIPSETGNYYIVKYFTDDLMLTFEQNGNSFTCSSDYGTLVTIEYNAFYSWCRDNIGCANDCVDVSLQTDSDVATLWFMTPVAEPLFWTNKLNEFYPELNFHHESMNSTGTYCSVMTNEGKMSIMKISSMFEPDDLKKLNCKIIDDQAS